MASLALYWSVMIACYLLASRLRRYADLHTVMTGAVEQYVRDVKECDFPNEKEQY